MNLKKHILDTIKEWQLKIGYREGNMKLYYPGEALADLLGIEEASKEQRQSELERALGIFCDEWEPQIGRIKVSGTYERYCLDISAKGCAYVARCVAEPEFLKRFLEVLSKPGNSMEQIRKCFAEYAEDKGTFYVEEHVHGGIAFAFAAAAAEEYVYCVEENEFGLNYHRFTREEYKKIRELFRT